MVELFLQLLKMSITASWIIGTIVILRLVLKKTPKNMICLLWGMVAIRLICPFAMESRFSFIPNVGQPFLEEQMEHNVSLPEYNHSNENDIVIDSDIHPSNQIDTENVFQNNKLPLLSTEESVFYLQDMIWKIWIAGIVVMICYATISYLHISRKIKEAVEVEEHIWLCDHVSVPFLMGIFHPRIILPSFVREVERKYVVIHEKTHLKRKDHFWKLLGFILLSIYWFNPMVWLAYFLFSRDIEFACDECVIEAMEEEERKSYIRTLLNCSILSGKLAVGVLSFGAIGVKKRIEAMVHYQKPNFPILLSSILISSIMVVGFMTNPESKIYALEGIKENITETSYTILEERERRSSVLGYEIQQIQIARVEGSVVETKKVAIRNTSDINEMANYIVQEWYGENVIKQRLSENAEIWIWDGASSFYKMKKEDLQIFLNRKENENIVWNAYTSADDIEGDLLKLVQVPMLYSQFSTWEGGQPFSNLPQPLEIKIKEEMEFEFSAMIDDIDNGVIILEELTKAVSSCQRLDGSYMMDFYLEEPIQYEMDEKCEVWFWGEVMKPTRVHISELKNVLEFGKKTNGFWEDWNYGGNYRSIWHVVIHNGKVVKLVEKYEPRILSYPIG